MGRRETRAVIIVVGVVAAACTSSSPKAQGDDGQADDDGASAASVDDGGDDGGSGTTGIGDSGSADGVDDGPATDEGSGGTETGTGEDIETWELRAGGFAPPQQETVYSCFSFTFPVDQLHHIVGFAPKVSSPLVHHYVLSLSDSPVQLDPNESCVEWPAHILWAWAPGVQDIMLPPDAGFLVGHQGPDVTFIMQVHYNNPLQMPFVDDGGIDVMVTKTLRPNRAGIFSQGDIFSISIPPGEPAYEYLARCDGALTDGLFPNQIHVFASFLHAHQLGSVLFTDVYRDGNMVGELARKEPFTFNTQNFEATDFDLLPGDRIDTHCIYDSTSRTDTTMGGEGSDEEMCINFMMYYPWIPSEACGLL